MTAAVSQGPAVRMFGGLESDETVPAEYGELMTVYERICIEAARSAQRLVAAHGSSPEALQTAQRDAIWFSAQRSLMMHVIGWVADGKGTVITLMGPDGQAVR